MPEDRKADPREPGRAWLQGVALFAGLLAAAALVYVATLALAGVSPGPAFRALEGRGAAEALGSAAEVVAGVLAIAITVVAIVVELAANRYTHRIPQLFTREPVNVLVMGFFVLTAVLCLWMGSTLGGLQAAPGIDVDATARIALAVTMAMVTVSLLLLLPYFGFVFRFVSPLSAIARIRRQAERAIEAACEGMRPGQRERVLEAVEELEDVARTAMEHQDRSIALASVDALLELVEGYVAVRGELPDAWFAWDGPLPRDPHFVSMEAVTVREVVSQRRWLETKVLRQYHSLFGDALSRAPDVANLIAVHTRRLAVETPPEEGSLHDLCVRFFNGYLRAAINARTLRAAYYVMHQMRLVGEHWMARGPADRVLPLAECLRIYGLLGFEMGQGFLLEVVAFDVSLLIERALEDEPGLVDPLLDLMLRVDKDGESRSQESSLRGVRRAQVRVGTLFLLRGEEERARRVCRDMRDERPERLAAVRQELLSETDEIYREFTERGVNFAWLSPDRRALVPRFFDLLEEERKGSGA